MQKDNRKVACTALAVLFIFGLTITIIPLNLVSASDTVFSVAWITDTQNLLAYSPGDFDTACTWLVNNAATLNLKAVIHTGDIVDTASDPSQWVNAGHSMGLLLSRNISYCWCAGNHDSFVSQAHPAFDTNIMRGKPYWVSDYNSGKNTAIRFSISNRSFLIINIEHGADSSILQWVNNLLDSNPSSSVIVGTHAYLDPQVGYGSWASNFKDAVLDPHPNVFLTLSGHFHPMGITASRTKVGSRDELFFDMQDADMPRGAATIRLLTFDTSKNTINVTTYVTYQNSFLTDSDNQFTLAMPSAPTPAPPLSTYAIAAVVFVVVIASIALVLRKRAK